MPEVIPQSVTKRVPLKLFLSSDHISVATGKTLAVVISKNGAAFGNPSGGATNATEIANGWYYVDLSTTDTGTAGSLVVRGTSASCDDSEIVYHVGNAHNAGFDGVPAATAGGNGGLPTCDAANNVHGVQAGGIDVTAFTAALLEAVAPAVVVTGGATVNGSATNDTYVCVGLFNGVPAFQSTTLSPTMYVWQTSGGNYVLNLGPIGTRGTNYFQSTATANRPDVAYTGNGTTTGTPTVTLAARWSDVKFANAVSTSPVTTVKAVQGLTTADTIATYTGNTPQTGDGYAVLTNGTYGLSASYTLLSAIEGAFVVSAGNLAQTGSTSTTIKLASGESATDNFFQWCWVKPVAGTGAGQPPRVITAYTGATRVATVAPAWTTMPDNTTQYVVVGFARVNVGAILDTASQGAAGYMGPDWGHVNAPTTAVNLSGTTVGTITTYTGDTPQTGDAYARIGAAGAGLTALGDARIAHLDADVSSRSTFAGGAVASVTGNVGGNVVGSVGSVVAGVTLASSAIDAGQITAAAANAIADALLDRANAIETGLTVRGGFRLLCAAEAGKVSGAATTTVTIRNAVADSKARITATVDSDGNRSAIIWDVT